MKLTTWITVFVIFLILIPILISLTYRYGVFPMHISEASKTIQGILDQVAQKDLHNTARAVEEFLLSEKANLKKVVTALSEDQKVKDYANFSLLGTLESEIEKIISASGVDRIEVYANDELLVGVGLKKDTLSMKESLKSENITFLAYRFFNTEYLNYLSKRFEAQFALKKGKRTKSTIPLPENFDGNNLQYKDRYFLGKNIIVDETQITVLTDVTDIKTVYDTIYYDLKLQQEKGENRYLIFWSFTILPVAFFMWWGFRNVIKPVEKGINAVERISGGDYNVSLNTSNVFGESRGLFRAINELSRNLKRLIKENVQKTLSIKNEKEKLETIIQNLDDGVLLLNDDNQPVLCNALGEKIYNKLKSKGLPENVIISENSQYQKFTVRSKEIKGIGILNILHDVTLEDEMKQLFIITENLKQFEKTARTIAHEIKNPLNAISLNLQILYEKLDHNTYGELVQNLLKQINTTASSIDKLLRLSDEEDEYHDINVGNLMERVISIFKFQSIEEKIRIDFINNSQTNIFGDGRRLSQAFFNLIHNAIKNLSSFEGNRVIRVNIEEYQERNEMVIIVEDSGPGIPKEQKNNVFVRAFTSRKDGHGIGLMMVKNIVENHEGQIELINSSLGGAAFKITLPLRSDLR